MSDSLPEVSGRDVVKAFKKLGFTVDRVSGSHHVLVKEGFANILVVPVHGATSMKKGTLRSLIRDAGISKKEFRKLL